MDQFGLLSLLRDRLRSEAAPEAGGHDGAAQRDHRTALVALDGRRPFAQILRDLVSAERSSLPGGVVVIAGIDPDPAHDGGDREARRIAPCLRQYRPDLALWALGRDLVAPDGALVVGRLDPENRTLERELDRIVADAHADPEPADGRRAGTPADPAFSSVDALLAALPDRRAAAGAHPAATTEPAWKRAEERCIHAYYEGRHAEGLAACDEVLASPAAPNEIRDQTLRNQTYYAPTLASLVRSFDHRRIVLALPPGWFATNPSIAAAGDGFLAIVRTVDFEIAGPFAFRPNDPSGRLNTVNYVVRLDDDLHPVAAYPAVDATLLEPRHPCRFAGLEDCRLVHWRGGWVASCGTVDRTPSCVGKIDLVHLDTTTGSFHSAVPLSDRGSRRWEKNWMPVVADDELFFVYGCDPLTVLRFDSARRAVVPHRRHPAPPIAREIKGGSQGVRVGGGWLFCVHQSADFRDRNRGYLHRFMLLDDDFRLTHLSRPFTFLAPGVEFCAGLALRGDDLVASFGVEDREAHVVRIALAEVLALLVPVAHAEVPTRVEDAPATVEPGRERGAELAGVDAALRISEGGWHVQGWARADPFAPVTAALVRPDGSVLTTVPTPEWLPRGADADGRVPFSIRFAFPAGAPASTDGLVLRLAPAYEPVGDAPLPSLVTADRAVLDALTSEIDFDRPAESWRRMAFLHGSIAPVHARLVASATVAHAEDLGALPVRPMASVVVALHRNLDYLERQLATFAQDPDVANWEVVILLDGPEAADAFLPLVRSAAARTGVPVKALVTGHNAGFSTANNLAADYARAPYIVLQNSDAFPAAPGWLSTMAAKHRSDPRIGAIGPKLIYPDGRVQSTGHDYYRLDGLPGWNWRSRHWGIPRDDPAVQVEGPVRGICGASIFLPTDVYRRAGGLPNCYLTGQFEDCELSDRIRELGCQPWYLASVDMVHEEAKTYRGPIRRREWLYNAWLYAQRQGDFLAAGG